MVGSLKGATMDNEFTTKVDLSDFTLPDGYGITQKVDLRWSIEMEYRTWGIKSINPSVLSRTIVVVWDSDEDLPPLRKAYDFSDAEIKYSGSTENGIFPSSIEVGRSGIEINF